MKNDEASSATAAGSGRLVRYVTLPRHECDAVTLPAPEQAAPETQPARPRSSARYFFYNESSPTRSAGPPRYGRPSMCAALTADPTPIRLDFEVALGPGLCGWKLGGGGLAASPRGDRRGDPGEARRALGSYTFALACGVASSFDSIRSGDDFVRGVGFQHKFLLTRAVRRTQGRGNRSS